MIQFNQDQHHTENRNLEDRDDSTSFPHPTCAYTHIDRGIIPGEWLCLCRFINRSIYRC